MITTYFVLKLTLDGILEECNRLAYEQEMREHLSWLKSRLIQLRTKFEEGLIDEETYRKEEAAILEDLDRLTQQIKSSSAREVGTNVEF